MRIFISYTLGDHHFAHVMREVLVKEGFDVWDPDRDLLPGSNWLTETGRALEHADAVVLLLSDESLHSPSAKREIQYVITQPKYENRVFPVRIGRSAAKIPWILNNLSVIDAPSSDSAAGAARKIATRLRPVTRPRAKRAARTVVAPKPRRTGRRSFMAVHGKSHVAPSG
jgi:hypothetical protein